MTRLNVQAAARWASGAPDQILAGQSTYQRIPMLLTLLATNEDGSQVDRLEASDVRVGFQIQPEVSEDSIAEISHFHHNGPTFGGTGWYSCIVQPPAANGWVQNEVFLCVTVRKGQGRGQALLLARYHVFA